VTRFAAVDDPPEAHIGAKRRFLTALYVSFGLWVALFFWLGCPTEPVGHGYAFKRDRTDYYNLLVDGFLGGHLSIDAPVDPGLLSPDPLVRIRAPYLLDTAVFRGRYFLYYGVTPAAVLLYPYALLTGQHISPAAACLIFVILGFGASVRWLSLLRDRLHANWDALFASAAVSILAVVPGTAFLVRRSMFYDLPIAAGYMCTCFLLISLWKAITGRHPGRWLVLSSAFFGLAVGCRPNLVLLCPSMAACAWWISRRSSGQARSLWLSAALPAAVIGLALAAYNFARFGNPLDFGFQHGLNSFFATGRPLFSARFLPANARAYLLAPPSLGPWFPFVYPIDSGTLPNAYGNAEAMCGFLPVTLLACCIGVAALAARSTRTDGPGAEAVPWIWALVWGAAVEALFTFLLGIRAYRYATDFLTPVAFLLVLGLARSWPIPGRVGRVARSCILVFGSLASVHVLLGAIQLFNQFKYSRGDEYSYLSSALNPRRSTLERLGAPEPGGVRLEIRFSRPAEARISPILTTGLPEAYDSMRCVVFPNGFVKFEIFHSGFGGPSTGLIPIVWDQWYTIEASIGSLYPSEDDPFFEAWAPGDVDAIKHLGWLRFDGNQVIRRRMQFFESSPWPTYVKGSGDAGKGIVIRSVESGLPASKELRTSAHAATALYAMDLVLPDARTTRPLPLLCSGVTGNGDLVYFDPLPDGRYRLGMDEWGIGATFCAPFEHEAGKAARVELVVGPALGNDPLLRDVRPGAADELRNRILVWYEGRLIGDFTVSNHLESFDTIYVGLNDAGFSSAVGAFSSEIKAIVLSADQRSALLNRGMSAFTAGAR
jgi:hypothetical protein